MLQVFKLLFDTHCHLNIIKNNKIDINYIIDKAVKNGVTSIFDISAGTADFFIRSEMRKEVTGRHECRIYLSAGIPPYFCDKRYTGDIDEVKKQAEGEESVAGIGEIGLDYFHDYGTKSRQISLFTEQIEIANELMLPIVVHTRDADRDLVETLKHHRPLKNGIIHCYSSGVQSVRKLLDLGFYISFAGNVTYKKSVQIRDAARYVPDDRCLIETDAPYLSPEGCRGRPNEPANIVYTASFLADIRGVDFKLFARQTADNAKAALEADGGD
jgi:TatD DNase family protein